MVGDAIATGRRIQHVAVNVAKIVKTRHDSLLKHDIEQSDIIGVDGMGAVWGCRLLGIPIPERVAGIDLMQVLLRLAAERGYRPYILGARPEVLRGAVENIRKLYPQLAFAGYRHGYFTAAEEPEVVEEIQRSRPDMLFIAMPTPQKERFLHRHRDALGVPFLMGVGGSVDVLAGRVTRAPRWMQSAGMEWVYRVLQEPRRLWRRYLVTNTAYAGLLAKEVLARILKSLHGGTRPRARLDQG